jgi:hypothetical protein
VGKKSLTIDYIMGRLGGVVLSLGLVISLRRSQ